MKIALIGLAAYGCLFGQFGAPTRVISGNGVPDNARCGNERNVGLVWARKDGAASASTFYVCSSTGASTFGWELLGTGGGGVWATIYVTTAVIDIISVPDGSCVLDTTAVTVSGAALGGKTLIGASYQPPEGVNLFAKVTGPNTVKIEVCNFSGSAYNPTSATYSFGVTA